MRTGLLYILLVVSSVLLGQNRQIRGYVQDYETGETLIGAYIVVKQLDIAVVTNNYGFFSFGMPDDTQDTLEITCVGYAPIQLSTNTIENTILYIHLLPIHTLKTVEVLGTQNTPIESRNEMSIVSIPMQEIKMLPALGGESDIMKAIQLMPGVQSGSEGSGGLYVRGGSPDQNLIILDDVPLYYVNHLGGFVSTFNTDAISHIQLTKGGFPARYGGRLSSVLDVRMKEGNLKTFHGSGMIGMLASKISLEGPIQTNSSSYIVSFRRFLYDLISKPITKYTMDGASLGYNFYDLNLKLNQKLGLKDRLFFSIYSGDDKISMSIQGDEKDRRHKSIVKWGNQLAAIRWNHLYSSKLFGHLTLTYTRYRFLSKMDNREINGEDEMSNAHRFASNIYDANMKIDFEFFHNKHYSLRMGSNHIYHSFLPGVIKYTTQKQQHYTMDTALGNHKLQAWEHAVYVENDIQWGNHVQCNLGMRVVDYHMLSHHYLSLEPRLLFNYYVEDKWAIKASYSQMQQNVHLLTSVGIGMPRDLWLPATQEAPPEKSSQIALAFVKPFHANQLECSIEAYYKSLKQLITYKDGASFIGSTATWEDNIENDGIGKAYGIEFLLRRTQGKLMGWLAYTLSKTDRQFANVNGGKAYAYKYDRRHDVSIVATYQVKNNIDVSATWVYGSGHAFSLPVGHYNIINDHDYFNGNEEEAPFDYDTEIYQYEGRNTFRMRAYHRLDVGVSFHKKKKWGERTWHFSIYNLYNRQNPYYYYFDSKQTTNYLGHVVGNQRVIKQMSLFPFIPSISYSFKF